MSTRDRLVGAMATSMRERGLGSSSMKDVLQSADVTAGSMYHHFPNGKDELAAEAIGRAGAIGHETLVGALEQSASAADGVARFFELLAADLESSEYQLGCPIGVPTSEAAGTIEAVRAAGRAVFETWVATISEALVADGWDAARARSVAGVAVALYEGSSLLARANRDSAVVRDAAETVRGLLRPVS